MNTDWIEESGSRGAAGDGEGRLALGSSGIAWTGSLGEAKAPWDSVLGVVLLPRAAPTSAYLLVPRRPPMPPWLEVGPKGLPPEVGEGGFSALADLVQQRSRQRGYRDVRRVHVEQSPAELRADVLARREIPGALEVPVGPGPIGRKHLLKRSFAGAVAGAIAGVMIHPDPFTIIGGAFAVSVLPTLIRRRELRARFALPGRPKRRVLVLCPDGAVVGLPEGVRAFSWSEIARFEIGSYAFVGFGGAGEEHDCLEVVEGSGAVAGRIDAAWFAEPLELIVAVAEAYRRRVAESSTI